MFCAITRLSPARLSLCCDRLSRFDRLASTSARHLLFWKTILSTVCPCWCWISGRTLLQITCSYFVRWLIIFSCWLRKYAIVTLCGVYRQIQHDTEKLATADAQITWRCVHDSSTVRWRHYKDYWNAICECPSIKQRYDCDYRTLLLYMQCMYMFTWHVGTSLS